MRALSLGCVLFLFWLLLSGHYSVLLVTLGVLSCAAIVLLVMRMQVLDDEGHPIHLVLPAFTFWPWLIFEILKSGWTVSKIILSPSLPISPTLTKVRAGQKTRVGVYTYANSITLTPGTISVDVQGNDILVHAITEGGALELAEGVMDKRVSRFEGAK